MVDTVLSVPNTADRGGPLTMSLKEGAGFDKSPRTPGFDSVLLAAGRSQSQAFASSSSTEGTSTTTAETPPPPPAPSNRKKKNKKAAAARSELSTRDTSGECSELPQDVHLAAIRGDLVGVARWLALMGGDVDARLRGLRTGTTLLCSASGLGKLGIVRALLQRGAKTDLQTAKGATALLLAVGFNHPRVVALLLEAGADPTIPDHAGETPLVLAQKRDFKNIAAMVYLKIQNNLKDPVDDYDQPS